MNEAPGLLLTIGLMGELIKKDLKGLLWTFLPRGGMPSNRVPSFAVGSMGGGGGWGGCRGWQCCCAG